MMQIRPLGGPLTAEHRTAAVHADAHAFFNTACPVRCGSADRRAAQELITPARFLSTALHDHRIESIAANLWVTPDLVIKYIQNLSVEDWLRMRNLIGHDPY